MLRRSILQMLIASPAFAATLVAMPGTARASGGGSNGGNDNSGGGDYDDGGYGGNTNSTSSYSNDGVYGGSNDSGPDYDDYGYSNTTTGTNTTGTTSTGTNNGVYGGSYNNGGNGASGPEYHLNGADADDIWLQQQQTAATNDALSSDGLNLVSPSNLSSVLQKFQ